MKLRLLVLATIATAILAACDPVPNPGCYERIGRDGSTITECR